MTTSTLLLAFLALPVALLSLVATVFVLRDRALSPGRRVMQVVLAWLVPVVGPIGVLVLQWVERQEAREALDRTAFADGPCAAGGAAPGEGCGCGGGGD